MSDTAAEPTRLVLVGAAEGLADALGAALPVPAVRLSAETLDVADPLPGGASPHGVAWVHVAPAAGESADALAEAALLLRSAATAREAAVRTDCALTFVGVLPAPGAFAGPACDLASSAMGSLMRTELGFWSDGRRRIVGVVHAGIEGHEPPGQRPLEEIRRRTPMATLGTVEQLADAIRFAGSQRASYITGAWLRVDGGADAYSWVYPTRTV